jgi:hypothetical protein
METERIQQEIENALIKMIRNGDTIKMTYDQRVDVSSEMRKAYSRINFETVFARISELIEEELAKKIVNKIVTEMGTDIKNLMSNVTVRDDFKFILRKGVDEIMQKVKNTPKSQCKHENLRSSGFGKPDFCIDCGEEF